MINSIMDTLIDWIVKHAATAHWFIFASILLAGLNIPISADVIIIISAILAATVVPENVWLLFFSVFIGCALSAQLAYWTGRLIGPQLLRIRYFAKLLQPARLAKIQAFYENHGFSTLIIGRFIPFGVRNAIFMTTGISKANFGKFVLRDSIACFIWTATCFSIFYALGNNYQQLKAYVHIVNILLFAAFSIAVIAFVWYKKTRKKTVR